MNIQRNASLALAASITKFASKQTYYTIRYFVDRDLVNDAYLAYGYFRWVDDMLDTQTFTKSEKIAFIIRQNHLLTACYRGESLDDICLEEQLLVELVRSDRRDHPGLSSYLKNMLAILEFDAERRGQQISQVELALYSQGLATAVTDAMHYFIGHEDLAPANEACYSAVNAAHITHMLRDMLEDNELGYFNIPSEYLEEQKISPQDVNHPAFHAWVCSRVKMARSEFYEGRKSLAQIKNIRCRLVGYAYTARFEWLLRTIEHENYCLRSTYLERKGVGASIWIVWYTFLSMLVSAWTKAKSPDPFAHKIPIKES